MLDLLLSVDSSGGSSDLSSLESSDENGTRLSTHNCPHCNFLVEFPQSMATPFLYCSGCHKSFHRTVPVENEYQSWGSCRGCLFYGEIQDFSRYVEFCTDGHHYKTEKWTASSCCSRCAKKALFPWRIKRGNKNSAYPELSTWDEANQISRANGILKKRMKKRSISGSDKHELRKAEATYESYLTTTQCYSPDLNYSLYLARSMRDDAEGAEAAVRDILRECGNYQPAVGALEWLMEQQLKSYGSHSHLKDLEGRYKLLMGNCLGRIAPPAEREKITRDIEIVWGKNKPSFFSLMRS